jgi:hypothetical protein
MDGDVCLLMTLLSAGANHTQRTRQAQQRIRGLASHHHTVQLQQQQRQQEGESTHKQAHAGYPHSHTTGRDPHGGWHRDEKHRQGCQVPLHTLVSTAILTNVLTAHRLYQQPTGRQTAVPLAYRTPPHTHVILQALFLACMPLFFCLRMAAFCLYYV